MPQNRINQLQLPEWQRAPMVDFATTLTNIGNRIGTSQQQQADIARESAAFGGLVDAAGQNQEVTPPLNPQAMPRGLRNNNPGNIEDGPLARSLPGYKGKEPGEGRFAVFDTPENGLNAMDALLTAYGRRGIKTVREITERWAPKGPKDPNNDPVKYATYVGGGDPDRAVDLSDPAQRKQIALAMARYENGLHGTVQQPGPQGMPAELQAKVRALFAAGTPAAQKAAIALTSRFLPGGGDEHVLREGDTLVRGGQVIAEGRPKRNEEDRMDERMRNMERLGIDPKSPGGQHYALTGKMPMPQQIDPALQLKNDRPTLVRMAAQARAGDISVKTGIGRGNQGGENLILLQQEMARQDREPAADDAELEQRAHGTEQAIKNAEYFGLKAGQRTLGTRVANIELASTELQKVMPILREAVNAVDRTKYPDINKIIDMWREKTGDPNIVRLGGAINTVVNVYARAIAPVGAATVSDKDHARELLQRAWAKGQILGQADLMEQEVKAALEAPDNVRDEWRKRFRAGQGGGGKTETKTETGGGTFKPPAHWEYSESRGQYRDPKTGKLYDKNGKEVKAE